MKNVAVIGAGTMGNGIAHTFAQCDYKVQLIDISEESLNYQMTVASLVQKKSSNKPRTFDEMAGRAGTNEHRVANYFLRGLFGLQFHQMKSL